MAVKASTEPSSADKNIIFTFRDFQRNGVCIRGVFNNHISDANIFAERLNALVFFALPLFSQQTYNTLLDRSLGNQLHFHQIQDDQLDIVEKILVEYGFPEERIDSIIEGNCIYQFSSELNQGMRVVAEKADNVFSVLFLDTNHHIYMNKALTQDDGSMFYDTCPYNRQERCATMPYNCYAFEYLDIEKLNESLGL